MLELSNITKSYSRPDGDIRVLTDVSLTVNAGEFLAVQGPSGCGKTTLLLAAGGMLHPDGGRVMLASEDFYKMNIEARAAYRARMVGFVFQQFHLLPYLSVLDNVLSPTLASDISDARNRAEELIANLGLAERRRHVPAELSTGERQRVAMARALLGRPKLLLADEPTGNLDAGNAAAVLDYLMQFARSGGAVLLVTHDSAVARQADRVIQMSKTAAKMAE
ncbi:MAG: ABC transporter ATP-binding protein [Planctomycetes bacterium]|nr:ABC transporter ATP-binding protein [Planctomycetota bacterium]